jgi:hypothetical protein
VTNGEVSDAAAMTPTDVREYRGYLQNVERRVPSAIKALMGHSELETTARYTQPAARDLEAAVGRLATEDDR